MRTFFRSVAAAPVVMLMLSGVAFAQAASQTGTAQSEASASTRDLAGVWLGDGAGNNRPLLSTPAAALMQPWAKAKFNAQGIVIDPDPFLESCEPLGVPRVLLTNTPVKIVQAPGEVVLLYERNHDFREVYMDGRSHPESLDPSWWGHSIGRWDGATLVIDTVGFNVRTWVDWTGLPHTEALHTVERYQRIDHDTMRLDLTVDDPKTYTQPFTVKRTFKLKPWDIGEDICTSAEEQHFRQGISTPAASSR
jgi:hypothetical protein